MFSIGAVFLKSNFTIHIKRTIILKLCQHLDISYVKVYYIIYEFQK